MPIGCAKKPKLNPKIIIKNIGMLSWAKENKKIEIVNCDQISKAEFRENYVERNLPVIVKVRTKQICRKTIVRK